jgi:hypothetical protein
MKQSFRHAASSGGSPIPFDFSAAGFDGAPTPAHGAELHHKTRSPRGCPYERADAPNRAIGGLAETDPCRRGIEKEPAEPRKRANFIFLAIFCSVGGSICACFLGILAFASALPGVSHKYGATVLSVLAKSLYRWVLVIATLAWRARETWRPSMRNRAS